MKNKEKIKPGYLSLDQCKKLQAQLTTKTVGETFILDIPIYQLMFFGNDFPVYIMQYEPGYPFGEDLRDKNIWYVFSLNSKKTNGFRVYFNYFITDECLHDDALDINNIIQEIIDEL